MDSRYAWACKCGCITHYLYSGGVIECANCEEPQMGDASGEFIDYLPAPKITMPKNEPENFHVIDMNSSDAALKRVANSIFEKRDELALVFCVFANGRFRHWRSGMNAEEIEWLQRRLTEFKDQLDEEVRTRKIAEGPSAESS